MAGCESCKKLEKLNRALVGALKKAKEQVSILEDSRNHTLKVAMDHLRDHPEHVARCQEKAGETSATMAIISQAIAHATLP